MDVFPPANLPGVGMGHLASVAGAGAMLGLAVTSGALLAEGLLGTLIFMVAAVMVLLQKPELGGEPAMVGGVLAVIVLAEVVRVLLARRGSVALQATEGAGKAPPAQQQSRVNGIAMFAIALGGAAVGYAWAEWNEVPFGFDIEAIVGVIGGLVAGLLGGEAARRFITGAVRAGGHGATVGATVAIVALLLNAASFYLAFVGFVVVLLAGVLVARLRRREAAKYKGLRMLR